MKNSNMKIVWAGRIMEVGVNDSYDRLDEILAKNL